MVKLSVLLVPTQRHSASSSLSLTCTCTAGVIRDLKEPWCLSGLTEGRHQRR